MKVKSGSLADKILNALDIPHKRILQAHSPEEYLLKYVIAIRQNLARGQDQTSQINKLRHLYIRAGFNGCEHSPEDMLLYSFDPTTPAGDEAYLAGWLIDEGYIKRSDIKDILEV